MISVKEQGIHKIVMIKKASELATIEQSAQLKSMLNILLNDSNIKSIVVDLTNVEYLVSSVIGILISGQKSARERDLSFSLVNVNEGIQEMLELASIKNLFSIYQKIEDIEV